MGQCMSRKAAGAFAASAAAAHNRPSEMQKRGFLQVKLPTSLIIMIPTSNKTAIKIFNLNLINHNAYFVAVIR